MYKSFQNQFNVLTINGIPVAYKDGKTFKQKKSFDAYIEKAFVVNIHCNILTDNNSNKDKQKSSFEKLQNILKVCKEVFNENYKSDNRNTDEEVESNIKNDSLIFTDYKQGENNNNIRTENNQVNKIENTFSHHNKYIKHNLFENKICKPVIEYINNNTISNKINNMDIEDNIIELSDSSDEYKKLNFSSVNDIIGKNNNRNNYYKDRGISDLDLEDCNNSDGKRHNNSCLIKNNPLLDKNVNPLQLSFNDKNNTFQSDINIKQNNNDNKIPNKTSQTDNNINLKKILSTFQNNNKKNNDIKLWRWQNKTDDDEEI